MPWRKNLNISLKALLALLLMHVMIFPDFAQYQEKGMSFRLIGYPISALAVYVYSKAKSIKPYPYKQDILVSLVIVIDMLGNALGFYGSVEWWDDLMHLLNCAILTVLVATLVPVYIKYRNLVNLLFIVGIISWLQVLWEIAEYLTFLTHNSTEIKTAYRDTIGDLFFGQIGLAITLIARIFYKNISV